MLKRRSVRWFLVAGSLGLGVAIILATLSSFTSVQSSILILLWPTSIIGLADPTRLGDRIALGTIIFGGNFLLYGAIGGIAGFAVDRLHR
jgi:hypothetical protein